MKRLLTSAGLLIALSTPAMASGLSFGDNTSATANNGICDDPRFEGALVNPAPQLIDRFHDANDCRSLYNNGKIILVGLGDIDFGDDSGEYTNDGECDDPRFTGSGVSSVGEPRTDATDCREQVALGNATLLAPVEVVPLFLANGSINFGADTGTYTNDGDCDDPRFSGPNTTSLGDFVDIGGDATDCRAAYNAGEAYVNQTVSSNVKNIDPNIDFGNDSGSFANDDECDDPRFSGERFTSGMSSEKEDATDCRVLYLSGLITIYQAPDMFLPDGSINFGDNSSTFANDDECDDSRFAGPGATGTSSLVHVARDRNDCEKAYRQGEIYIKEVRQQSGVYDGIDFGDNSSGYANDGECDDPRFEGTGRSSIDDSDHEKRDAADCISAYIDGTAQLIGKTAPGSVVNNIDFGDDSGSYANDGECDDPRFEGPGSSDLGILANNYIKADASDCIAQFQAGRVTFDGDHYVPPIDDAVNFGDNSSSYAFDGECDDPRFAGEGMASFLSDSDLMKDANDCRALYNQGKIRLADTVGKGSSSNTGSSNTQIDFGNDTSLWANDGVCDDSRFSGEGMATSLSDNNIRRDATDCRSAYDAGTIQLR